MHALMGSLLWCASVFTEPVVPAATDPIIATEVVESDNAIELLGYDDSGEITGSIAVWVDSDGLTWIVPDYADGFAEITIDAAGQVSAESNMPLEIVAERTDAMILSLAAPTETAEGRVSCALSAAGSVVSCAAGSWFCPVTAISTACNCLPLIVDGWEGKRCPGFG
jgi:hypothetical protein